MTQLAINISRARVDAALGRLSRPRARDLLERIGAMVVSSTQRRISQDKQAPDGTVWEPWSDGYAATRHSGHSLLRDTGALLESIDAEVRGDELLVGSPLKYARHVQRARPFLGLSRGDEDDIAEMVDDWAREMERAA